jgi:hypothetical protein
MHSRLFQISDTPINEDSYTLSEDYEGTMLDGVADYITDCDRDDGIYWLKSSLENVADFSKNEHGEYFVLADEFKKAYFENKYKRFMENIEQLNLTTLDDFSTSKLDSILFKTKWEYDCEFGFWADYEGETQTMDSFMRYAEPKKNYYIGAILDYHS